MKRIMTGRAARRPCISFEPLERRAMMSGDHVAVTRQIQWAVADHRVDGFVNSSVVPPGQSLGVAVFDGAGAFDAGYTGDVTLALTGTNPGVVTGTLTEAATAGYAEFGDLTFSAPGTYTLTAHDAAGDPVGTTTVTVQPADTRCQMAIVSGPTLDAATGTFGVTVAIEDANGNVVPNDANDPTLGSAGPANIVIVTGPGGGPAVFTDAGGTEPTATSINPDGTQTFTGLKVSVAGTFTFDVIDGTPICGAVTGAIDLPASPLPAVPVATPTPTPIGTAAPIGVTTIGSVDPTPTASTPTATTPPVLTRQARRAERQAEAKAARIARAAARAAKVAAHRSAVATVRAARLAAKLGTTIFDPVA